MTDLFQAVREATSSLSECIEDGRQVIVPTHFVYPSRSHVCVTVSNSLHGRFVVSDGAGATDIISSHGITLHDADKFLAPFCGEAGLRPRRGAITSKHVTSADLPGTIVVVAEASAKAAYHAVHKYRPKRKRDFFGAVKEEIEKRFAPERINEHGKVIGASHRQYRFDFVIGVGDDRSLLLDLVMPEPNSINAKAVANIDVARLESPRFFQRLVYDDSDEWTTQDLTFLQLAAPAVALSRLPQSLQAAISH